jgi:molybdate transport system substrate-binding protein
VNRAIPLLTVCMCALALLLAACGRPRTPGETPPGARPQPAAQAATGQLRVGVPCGLVPAYEACKKLFLAEFPGVTLKDDVRNIDPLTRAIRDGKTELDVYLGLGERETRSIVDKGLARGEPTPFLKQSLRLAVPKGNPLGIHAIEDLADEKVHTVAICTDDLAIGQAAEKALRGTGVWDTLESSKRVVRLPQPAQAKELVFKGKADATFVFGACTDESWTTADPERATQGRAEVVLTVPDSLYGGMHAQAVVLTTARDPELAKRFVQFLLRPECQKAIVQWGYDPIEGAESAAR